MPDGMPRYYCIECASHHGVAAFQCDGRAKADGPRYEFQRCDACGGFDDDDDAIEWLAFLLHRGYLELLEVYVFDDEGKCVPKIDRDGLRPRRK